MEQARTRRESEVWQVCDELWAAQGIWGALTGDAIRDRLVQLGYKRGSPNEIYKYRHTWKLSRHIVGTSEHNAPVAAEGTDPISRAVAMVKEELRLEANQEIEAQAQIFEAEKQTFLTEQERLMSALQAHADKIAGLEQVLEENKQRLHEERQAHAETQVQLQDTRQLASLMQGRLDKAEQQNRDEAVLYAKQIEELKSAHAALCDTLRASLATAKQEHAKELVLLKEQLKSQGEKAMDESNALKIQMRNSERVLAQITAQKEQLMVENQRVHDALQSATPHLATLAQENARLTEKLVHVQASLEQYEHMQTFTQQLEAQAAQETGRVMLELKRLSEQLDKLQPVVQEEAAQ